MEGTSVGFIGGGRVARIMLEGWLRTDAMPARVVVSDPDAAALERLRSRYPVEPGDNCRAAEQDVVFVGLHPPVMAGVAAEIRDSLRSDAVVVSLAPKITVSRLTELLGGFDRIARVNPNAPSYVGAGFNPVAFGPALVDQDREAVLRLLAPLGESPVVDEATIEAYAITSAMGPTYLWFQLYELRALAESFGLTREAAETAIDRMVRGALDAMWRSELSPAEVMDLVPVHPLGDAEPAIVEAYRTKLAAVAERIRPA